MKRLILLDRDGTVNVERHYLSTPGEVALCPNAADGIRRMRELGFVVAVVSNQSGLARGYFTEATLTEIHQRLASLLAEQGADVDAFFFCPHHPDDRCDCRKPMPGMALRAATQFGADLGQSYVIGDKACDIALGRAVGATPILVRTGYGASEYERISPRPIVVDDLLAAAKLIASLNITSLNRLPREGEP